MKIIPLLSAPQYMETVSEWVENEFSADRPKITKEYLKESYLKQKEGSLPQTYIALEGDRLCGTITMSEHILQGETLSPWMGYLYVTPEMRKSGVAKSLIACVKRKARALGFDTLYVRTEHACGYYEKTGWEFVKETIDMEHNLNTTVYKTETSPFRVRQLSDVHKSVALFDDDAKTSATIAVGRGANLMQFSALGREIIYTVKEVLDDTPERVREGTPVLFPACGRHDDCEYTLNGQKYPIAIHGFASALPWEMVDTSTDGGASVTVQLCSDDETRKSFPFDFKMQITFTLVGNKITATQKFYNLSNEVMPFVSGLHPYFRADNSKCIAQVDGQTISFMDEIDNVYSNISDKTAVLDSGLGYKVIIDAIGEYTTYVCYTTLAGFACVEPWTACPNALNTKKDLIYLNPGEEKTLTVSFEASLNN